MCDIIRNKEANNGNHAWEVLVMATNLALDDELLKQAVRIGGLKTKKETVTLALKEFIQRRKAEELIDAFGTMDFDASYDYKAERNRHA